jgi:hypothetical protein
VSERAGVKAGGSNLSAGISANPSRVVTVESIPAVGKAVLFAGHCRNGGLGRSVNGVWVPPCAWRADDSGCSKDAEEGNVRQYAPVKAHALEASTHVPALRGRVLHSVLRPVPVNPHYALRGNSGWWGGRKGITVGQTRGTGRNQHWGSGERTERGSSRVTAFARKRRGTSKKRKAVEAVVPTRIGEFRVWLPARRSAIAEVDRRRSGPK